MIDKWSGCYDDGWHGDIVPEAFSHPAKFSHGLIHRIYLHAKEMGWVKPGDWVLDPFGGVALGGLDALAMGLNWVGVELEAKFVSLGEQNIELWQRQLKGWPNLGTARIVRGDSRRLKDVIIEANLIVSSPPYAEIRQDGGSSRDGYKGLTNYSGEPRNYWRTQRDQNNLGNMPEGSLHDVLEQADIVISSPPFCDKIPQQDANFQTPHDSLKRRRLDYGSSPGQLGSMKEGKFEMVVGSPPFSSLGNQPTGQGQGVRSDYKAGKRKAETPGTNYGPSPGQLGSMKEGSFDLCVSSPPYSEIASGAGGLNTKPPKNKSQQSGRSPKSSSQNTNQHYGHTPGNLANLKEGKFEMVVSSPPYEDSLSNESNPERTLKRLREKVASGEITGRESVRVANLNQMNPNTQLQRGMKYSPSDNNLGNSSGDTFWSASREIVQQCFDLLKPGGHAIWVCKDYVKNKKRVPFSDRWQALCESVGFKLVCCHQSMLVKEHGTQTTIHGDEKITTERKSFFRRLAESKGSPRIDWEDILCLVKQKEN